MMARLIIAGDAGANNVPRAGVSGDGVGRDAHRKASAVGRGVPRGAGGADGAHAQVVAAHCAAALGAVYRRSGHVKATVRSVYARARRSAPARPPKCAFAVTGYPTRARLAVVAAPVRRAGGARGTLPERCATGASWFAGACGSVAASLIVLQLVLAAAVCISSRSNRRVLGGRAFFAAFAVRGERRSRRRRRCAASASRCCSASFKRCCSASASRRRCSASALRRRCSASSSSRRLRGMTRAALEACNIVFVQVL